MIGLHERNGCFNTLSGVEFNFQNPTPEMVCLTDIAKGLAYKPHFGGHTPEFFSIAQHCTLVVEMLPNSWRIDEPEIALVALMHDAAEAYIGDMIKPIKELLPLFEEIEDKILEVIFKKFNLNISYLGIIKEYDSKAQELEFETFYKGAKRINYLGPEEALNTFINYFDSLNLKRT